jgi:hypothetical protein
MLELRPIVYDPSQGNLVLGGNMRLRAIKKLGLLEIPTCWTKSAEELTDEEKQRFIIEDNIGFGEWDYDILANDGWNVEQLTDWGMEMPNLETGEMSDDGEGMTMGQKLARDKQRNATKMIFCIGMGTAWTERNDLSIKVEKILATKYGDEIALYAIEKIHEKYG